MDIQILPHIKNEILQKIETKQALVSIIGLGYVGLPLAVAAADAGFRIIGVENNPERCHSINLGKSYIKDISHTKLSSLVKKKHISAHIDFSPIQSADIVIICVPTPLNKNKEPDISYIHNALKGICQHFHSGMLIILESTTFPGTTEEIIQYQLESLGYKLGKDFFLSYSPERVDPGNKIFNTSNTAKLIGGLTDDCRHLTEAFYRTFINNVVTVSSPRTAEMTKVFENVYRAVNIALVNELAMLCERMDIDVYEVITAANTKPYGFQAFWPGPGVGGHCIPLDPYYLAWKGKEYDIHARFIELAGDINSNMPRIVLQKISEILNQSSKPLKGSYILQLGVSYKKDTNDARESPAVRIYELLTQKGAYVEVSDPCVTEFWTHDNDFTYGNEGPSVKTITLTPEQLKNADLVLITTDHSDFPYMEIIEHAKIIFDTRNATGFRNIISNKIIKLSTRITQNH